MQPIMPVRRPKPQPLLRPAAAPAGLLHLVWADLLDAELGGLLWLLVERGCPFVVAGPSEAGGREARVAVLDGLLGLVAPGRTRIPVLALEPADGVDCCAVAGDLGAPPVDPATARAVAGAASLLDRGLALSVALEADALEMVLRALSGPGFLLGEDRLSYLGLVLVLATPDPAHPHGALRVAHYLRPVARDAGGHLQRLPPAVLAARDERSGRFEHFAWGVVPELAARVGLAAAELETEASRRAALLAGGSGGSGHAHGGGDRHDGGHAGHGR